MIRLISALGLLVLPVFALQGQQVDVRVGAHVRVLSDPARAPLIGTIIGRRVDSLFLRNGAGETLSLPVSSINRLQVGRKRQDGFSILAKSGAGLLLGAAAGALAGPLVASGACLSVDKDPQNLATCTGDLMKGNARTRAGIVGGLGGAVIGAIAGLVIGTERWEEIEIRRVRPTVALHRGGVGTTLTLRF